MSLSWGMLVERLESAIARHDRMVREEREQAERVRTDGGGTPDIWKRSACRFGPGGLSGHVALEALASLTEPAFRVIDVGAGGGRITIPLARQVNEMVAVEPSPAMREVLATEAEQEGVTNLTIVPDRWEDVEVAPADLVYAANVTYGIQDIEPFLRKMDVTATRIAALVTFVDPPQYLLEPFWRQVYSEERLRLPCRDELLDALKELGVEPRLIELPPLEARSFGSPDDALDELRRRLFIGVGTPHEARLRDAIALLTVERDGELWPVHDRPNERSVVWWQPGMTQPHV